MQVPYYGKTSTLETFVVPKESLLNYIQVTLDCSIDIKSHPIIILDVATNEFSDFPFSVDLRHNTYAISVGYYFPYDFSHQNYRHDVVCIMLPLISPVPQRVECSIPSFAPVITLYVIQIEINPFLQTAAKGLFLVCLIHQVIAYNIIIVIVSHNMNDCFIVIMTIRIIRHAQMYQREPLIGDQTFMLHHPHEGSNSLRNLQSPHSVIFLRFIIIHREFKLLISTRNSEHTCICAFPYAYISPLLSTRMAHNQHTVNNTLRGVYIHGVHTLVTTSIQQLSHSFKLRTHI